MENKQLELKLKDYLRFIASLIILGTYLFFGGIINVYIQPSENGAELFYLSFALLLIGLGLSFKYIKLKKTIEKNERI
ncbi:YrhC family protein [Oceanobacillus limi]|uniref:YrhC family protein n=1 Tax=Oceanobacillus limi TaxID=930131 RepID=UPI001479D8FC|nr:YrhC family protein [Oceanobacillus limi]